MDPLPLSAASQMIDVHPIALHHSLSPTLKAKPSAGYCPGMISSSSSCPAIPGERRLRST